jgi:hypothetical protein
MSLVPPGRAARPEAASSVAPRPTSLGALVRREAPSAIASERPSHPGDEASLGWSLLVANSAKHSLRVPGPWPGTIQSQGGGLCTQRPPSIVATT